jgi:hypothetical protein
VAPGQRCQVCGANPAKKIFLVSFIGVAIMHIQRMTKGAYCRACGTTLLRDHTARSLTLGWWSLYGVLLVPISLLFNIPARLRIAGLAEPRGQTGPGLPNARPALARPATLVVLILVLGFIALIAASSLTSS